jgi:hypothetical protein
MRRSWGLNMEKEDQTKTTAETLVIHIFTKINFYLYRNILSSL